MADVLGNTPAVARASYVDPRVIDRWSKGDTLRINASDVPSDPDAWSPQDRREVELAVVDLLDLGSAARAGAKQAPGSTGKS